jgi:hypothetical protein
LRLGHLVRPCKASYKAKAPKAAPYAFSGCIKAIIRRLRGLTRLGLVRLFKSLIKALQGSYTAHTTCAEWNLGKVASGDVLSYGKLQERLSLNDRVSAGRGMQYNNHKATRVSKAQLAAAGGIESKQIFVTFQLKSRLKCATLWFCQFIRIPKAANDSMKISPLVTDVIFARSARLM